MSIILFNNLISVIGGMYVHWLFYLLSYNYVPLFTFTELTVRDEISRIAEDAHGKTQS